MICHHWVDREKPRGPELHNILVQGSSQKTGRMAKSSYSTCCVPGTILSTLPVWSHLILTIILWGRCFLSFSLYEEEIAKKLPIGMPRFTTFCFTVLHRCCVFLQKDFAEQVYRCHFPNSMGSLHVSESHFGNFLNISNFSLLLYLLWWSVIMSLLLLL